MGGGEARVALETIIMKDHIEQRIITSFIYQCLLDTDAILLPTIVRTRTALADLEQWVPKIQRCRLVLHLSGSCLILLSGRTCTRRTT